MSANPTNGEIKLQIAALRQEISTLREEHARQRANFWRVSVKDRPKIGEIRDELRAFIAQAETDLRKTMLLAQKRGLI